MSNVSLTALVTGGADRIGRAIALHLASRGYHVAVHYHRSVEKAEETARMIRARGRNAFVIQADFTQKNASEEMIAKVESALGQVDALVHAASRFVREPIESLSEDELSAHWQINVAAPMLLVSQLAARPQGRSAQAVFLTDALHGYSISGNYFAYALTRRALESAVPLLALRLAPQVRVNALALGYAMQNNDDTLQTMETIRTSLPLRALTPLTDITQAMDFLLASESITGEIIHLASGGHLNRTER